MINRTTTILTILLVSSLSCVPAAQTEKSNPHQSEKSPQSSFDEQMPLKINSEADFKTYVLDSDKICLVVLYSEQCGPCKILEPILQSLADRYAGAVTICKVDVDQLPSVSKRYMPSGFPTVLFIKNGKLLRRLLGPRPEAKYAELLDKYISDANE